MIIQNALALAGLVAGQEAPKHVAVGGLFKRAAPACTETGSDPIYQKALCRERELTGCGWMDAEATDHDNYYRYLVPNYPTSPCQR